MAPNLLTLFVEPSVALLYFMSVIVLSCAALFMALGQRARGKSERAAGRFTVASLGITLSWMALMGGAVVVLLTSQPSAAIMPPLDRAVGAMVILLAGWAFLDRRPRGGQPSYFDEDTAVGNAIDIKVGQIGLTVIAVLVVLAILVAYFFTAVQWFNGFTPFAEFNLSAFGAAWTLGTAILALVVLLLLVVRFRITADAPLKIIFLLLVLAGYGYTLIAINNGVMHGNDSGVLRLAFLAAMPLLPVVVYRMVVERLSESVAEQVQQATVATLNTISANLIDTTAERESVTLLKALGVMLDREKPEDLPRQIIVAAATTLKADVTALLVIDDAEYADVIAAYDNIQQRAIAAMALKLDEQPTLQDAISSRIQKVLTTDQNLNEMVDLFTRLDIQKVGPVYFQPLTREGELIGMLVVAMPYSQRDLREQERRLLESFSPMAARMLGISRAAYRTLLSAQSRGMLALFGEGSDQTQADSTMAVSAARSEMQASLELARAQINELSAKVRDLQIELDYEHGRMAELVAHDPEGLSITQRMEKMAVERSQLEAERERLIQALQEAQAQLASASGNDEELYEAAIQIIEKERLELQAQKDKLEAELAEIRARGETQAPAILRDMLTRLSEEKAQFSAERDQLKAQLTEVETQLAALGIEGGPAGVIRTIAQLTEERSYFKTLAERAAVDRDMLLTEMQKFRDRIASEQQRDNRIASLENEVTRLAQDREALTTQRDSLRQERDALTADRGQWEALRTRMVADLATLQQDLEEITFERNRAIAERNKLAEERATLLTERDKLAAGRTTLQSERDQLLARAEGNRELLQQLGADGVGALKKMIDDLTEERSDLEHKLLQAQNQARILREQLVNTQKKRVTERKSKPGQVEEETASVMLSVAQELRTPLSSIVAYVDLLLGESVGILGDLQMKFLQRVKANSDRLATLVEDFVRVVAIDTGRLNLKMEPIDVAEVVDDAITSTRTQFREKGISLKLDLPDQLPLVKGDRGALQQVVVELLSNAYRASPTDGEVAVTIRHDRNFQFPTENEAGAQPAEVVFLSVHDKGGGIPPEEQGRVFNRLYRADNPLIQGLGDTGVGLSVARALTEAHSGRIWVESQPGESSTFMLAIPLSGQRAENGAS